VAKTGSIPVLGIEHGGHSDRETPEPIPNSEDKPVHVLHCTQMRELSGTADRCRAHLTFFCFLLLWIMISKITAFLIPLSIAARSMGCYAPEKAKQQIAAVLT
jgi:hypothetical protein